MSNMSNTNGNGNKRAAAAADVSALAGRIVRQVRADFGQAWASRLSAADRALVEAVAADAAAVVLAGLAGPPGQAAREKAQVDAQLANVTSVESARVAREFWASVAAAVKDALGIALALA